jgi:glycogen synthase
MAIANLDPTLFLPLASVLRQGQFLKAGLVFSDRINTVSRKYSREIQTNSGMAWTACCEPPRMARHLNGIDYDRR